MADNIEVAGKIIATDEIASVHHQRVKLIHGADGTNDSDVARSNPLPVDAILNNGLIQNGLTQYTPQFASISLTATGDVVTLEAGKRIVVLSLFMHCENQTGDETYQFKDATGGTAVTGTMGDLAAAGSQFVVAMGFNPCGWFRSASGSDLELALAGTSPSAQGCLTYIKV